MPSRRSIALKILRYCKGSIGMVCSQSIHAHTHVAVYLLKPFFEITLQVQAAHIGASMSEKLCRHVVRYALASNLPAVSTNTNTKELAERAPQRSRTDLRRFLATSACEAYQWRTEAIYNVKLHGCDAVDGGATIVGSSQCVALH